jgi:hypothetical protein
MGQCSSIKQERDVLDALLLEVLGGLDTLVGGSNLHVSFGDNPRTPAYLDQDSLLVDTKGLVKVNELVSLGDCSLYQVSANHLWYGNPTYPCQRRTWRQPRWKLDRG